MKGKKTLKDYILNTGKGVKSAIAGLGLLAMVSTIALPPVHAEEVYSESNEDDWKIEVTIDTIPFLQSQGLEEKMGASGEVYDEWSDSYEWGWGQEPPGLNDRWETTWNYGAELNPIKVDPGAGPKMLIKPRVSLYSPFGIGFHAEGWWVSGSDSKSGEVPGLFSEINIEGGDNSFTVNDTLSTGIVSMWDQIFYSYWNEYNSEYDEQTDSETWEYNFYPEKTETKYEVSRDFKLLNASLFASIPVVPTIRAFGGLRGQLFEINDMQRVRPIFHRETHETYNYSDGSFDISDYVFHNNMDLQVNSSIIGYGLGPMIGLMGSANVFDWMRVYGDFSKSWIRLKTERTANFSDIDDISESSSLREYDSNGNLIYENAGEGTTYLEGKFPFTVEQTHNVSQTELNLGLEFLLGKHVTLSAGYWNNIMQSMPEPAKFHYIPYTGFDDNNLNKLWEYEVEAKDISTQGFTIGINIKY